MSDKTKDKKVGGVGSTTNTTQVHQTDSVGEVKGVKSATGIGAIKATRGIKESGGVKGIVSAEERAKLLAMVTEEAEKMAHEGSLPKGKKEVLAKAVAMAIDSGLIVEE